MLIHDLWTPREEQRFFDVIRLELADGRCLYFERVVRRSSLTVIPPGAIYCCVQESATAAWNPLSTHSIDPDDELTAQAVLDHSVQTIGLKINPE